VQSATLWVRVVQRDWHRKLIGRKPVNLIVGWWGRFLFFVVPHQFSQDIGEWPENQILIPWIAQIPEKMPKEKEGEI